MSRSVTTGKLITSALGGTPSLLSPAAEGARQSGPTIFDLPLFLREWIYDCIFDEAVVGVDLKGNKHCDDCCPYIPGQPRPCLTLAIAQTCRFVRAEALPRFYKMVTLWLCCQEHNMNRLMTMMKRGKRRAHLEDHAEQSSRRRQTDVDSASYLGRHLKTVSMVIGHVRHITINACDVNLIGWDLESWTWTSFFYETFPRLESLGIVVNISNCDCGASPSTSLHSDARQSCRAEKAGRIWTDRGEYDPTDVDNGEYIYRLWRDTPYHIWMIFGVCLSMQCGDSPDTNITLIPGDEWDFELKDEGCHGGETNRILVYLLEELGMHRQADRMRGMMAIAADGADGRD